MYRTELMRTSQMYLIMVIGIRKYQMNKDEEELLKILSLVNTCDDSLNNTCIYKELIEAFMAGFAKEYIDYKLEDMDVESYHYEVLMNNFKGLREYVEDDTTFLTKLESQLHSLAYWETSDADSYDETTKIVEAYMLSEKLLYSSMVYKYNGIVLREKFVFLKPVVGTLETMKQKRLIL